MEAMAEEHLDANVEVKMEGIEETCVHQDPSPSEVEFTLHERSINLADKVGTSQFLQGLFALAASQWQDQTKAKHYELVAVIVQIQQALRETAAKPDRALVLLDRFKSEVLPNTKEEHLLEHPEAVNVIRQITNYGGNSAAWNFSDDQVREFKEKSKQIRKKAEEIIEAIKAIFPDEPQDSNEFFESFAVKANLYNPNTTHRPTISLRKTDERLPAV